MSITRLGGDALAVLVVAVTPLGAVRSFVAPALVIGGAPVAALAAGLVGAFAAPLLCGLLPSMRNPPVHPPAADLPEPHAVRAQRRQRDRHLAGTVRLLWVIGAVFVLTDIWLIVAPLNATHVLGVLATAVIAIGSLATLRRSSRK